jgi:hypothetical protein
MACSGTAFNNNNNSNATVVLHGNLIAQFIQQMQTLQPHINTQPEENVY